MAGVSSVPLVFPPREVPSVAFAERPAVVDDSGRTVTYRGLGDRALRVGASLRPHGLVHGDRFVLLTANRPGFFELEHAAFRRRARPAGAESVVDELPKTGSGKIQRKQVGEPFWAAEQRRVGG